MKLEQQGLWLFFQTENIGRGLEGILEVYGQVSVLVRTVCEKGKHGVQSLFPQLSTVEWYHWRSITAV